MKIFALSIALAASALCAEMQPGRIYNHAGTSVMIKHACSAPVTGFVCAEVKVNPEMVAKVPFLLVTANPSGPGVRHTILGIPRDGNGNPMPMEAYIPASEHPVSVIWVWPVSAPAAFLNQQ
jgi:hypothetical protein